MLHGSDEICKQLADCAKRQCSTFHHPRNEKAQRLRLQALGLNLDQNKSQVVNNHAISRVNEPRSTDPQDRRRVEPQIRYLNYQNVLGESTAPDRDANL
jgi:hypothetical protein